MTSIFFSGFCASGFFGSVTVSHFGSFERSFEVPDGVDVDKIEASFKKGVLFV